MIVTKAQIIKALETEPLQPGEWIQVERGPKAKDCHVCAIGAVLRSCNVRPSKIREVALRNTSSMDGSSNFDIRYWEELSDHFEFELSQDFLGDCKPVNKTQRKKLISWVKKNLPEALQLEIKSAELVRK